MSSKGLEVFIISDTHFGHENMVKWALRPTDFNEKLWALLDEIPADSILIHCGDITMGADATTHIRLQKYPFKKWLIRGNHDNHGINWYIKNGWDFVADEIVIQMFGNKFLFSHEPLPKREGIFKNIHGHLHGGISRGFPDFYDDTYHIEVTPEAIGYRLVKLSQKL